MDQIGGDEVFGSVPVDVAKLEEGYAIAVAIGGSDVAAANVYKALIVYDSEEEQPITYTVSYDPNGGTVEGENPSTFDADDTIAAFIGALIAPTKTDLTGAYTYTFAGWSTEANGTAIDLADESALMTSLLAPGETSITLYALYTETANKYYLGDVDGNKRITLVDYSQVLLKFKRQPTTFPVGNKFTTASGTEFYLGDVDGNKRITLVDYSQILLKFKRQPVSYPVGEQIQ